MIALASYPGLFDERWGEREDPRAMETDCLKLVQLLYIDTFYIYIPCDWADSVATPLVGVASSRGLNLTGVQHPELAQVNPILPRLLVRVVHALGTYHVAL